MKKIIILILIIMIVLPTYVLADPITIDRDMGIAAFTICYSTKNLGNENKINYYTVSCEKQRIEQRIYSGQKTYSKYFTVDMGSSKDLYIGIRSVELFDGTIIRTNAEDIQYAHWIIK